MAQPCLFTKQIYKSNKKPGPVHSAQKLQSKAEYLFVLFCLFISDRKFQKLAIAVPEWKSKIAAEQ